MSFFRIIDVLSHVQFQTQLAYIYDDANIFYQSLVVLPFAMKYNVRVNYLKYAIIILVPYFGSKSSDVISRLAVYVIRTVGMLLYLAHAGQILVYSPRGLYLLYLALLFLLVSVLPSSYSHSADDIAGRSYFIFLYSNSGSSITTGFLSTPILANSVPYFLAEVASVQQKTTRRDHKKQQ